MRYTLQTFQKLKLILNIKDVNTGKDKATFFFQIIIQLENVKQLKLKAIEILTQGAKSK